MKYRILLFVSLLGILSSCGGDDDTQVEENQTPTTNIVDITNITDFEAQVNVTMQNGSSSTITERGVVYGLEANPTVNDMKVIDSGNQNTFSVNINGLTSATQYFVRSYFIVGGEVTYSGSNEFVTTDPCNTNVYNGTVELETQADVESFGSMGYCRIDGTLKIGSNFNDNDKITDISSLMSIEKVEDLLIANTLLANLDDLMILSLSRRLIIENNENLTSISKLNSTSVNEFDFLGIFNNPVLASLDGLQNITSVDSGFGTGFMVIEKNNEILSLDSLQNLTSFAGEGTISISDNANLRNLDGLSNMTNVDDGFGVEITLFDNPLLENLHGISGLEYVGALAVYNNDSIINLEGCENFLQLSNLDVALNENLISLEGLSIDGGTLSSLAIQNNPSLINLNGLQSLISCGGVTVVGNDNLLNLEGLENLNSLSTSLEVLFNASLINFCSLTNLIQGNGFQGNYSVSDNAYNPTQQDIIDGNCSI